MMFMIEGMNQQRESWSIFNQHRVDRGDEPTIIDLTWGFLYGSFDIYDWYNQSLELTSGFN